VGGKKKGPSLENIFRQFESNTKLPGRQHTLSSFISYNLVITLLELQIPPIMQISRTPVAHKEASSNFFLNEATLCTLLLSIVHPISAWKFQNITHILMIIYLFFFFLYNNRLSF
jgi:hypothetical protein